MFDIKMDKKINYPNLIFFLLPFSLFFPIGIMYAGIILFILISLFYGQVVAKFNVSKSSPFFIPAVGLLAWILFELLFLSNSIEGRWSALIHYLIFLFGFIFISAGDGAWKKTARDVYIAGAIYGATVYYLSHLNILPNWIIFKNFAIYAGNKSIALGIFHAIAAAWLLDLALSQTDKKALAVRLIAYFYISSAVLLFAMTRTGILLWFLLSLIAVLRHVKFSVRGMLSLLLGLVTLFSAWQFSPVARERAEGTIQSVRDFYHGQMGSGQGNRLQFIKITGEMILEKPIIGHGIGSWLEQYPERALRAGADETHTMSTPHNDYLLYGAELGAVGVIGLLSFYLAIAIQGIRQIPQHGLGLFLISVTFFVGSMFNALLRDWKFGMPMMILLAIAYRGSSEVLSNEAVNDAT
jgi:O-antigen ligase